MEKQETPELMIADSLHEHLDRALVLTSSNVNRALSQAFGRRFFSDRPRADEVRSWPQIGRTDLPFRIHRAAPNKIAAVDRSGVHVLFFRDPDWLVPLVHPKCIGRGVGTESLIAELAFDDRPRGASSYSLAGFASQQSVWRKARERAGFAPPPVKTTPEQWNEWCFHQMFPDPKLAFEEAIEMRSELQCIYRPGDIHAFCILAQLDQQAQLAKTVMSKEKSEFWLEL